MRCKLDHASFSLFCPAALAVYQSICESLQHPSPSGDSVLPGNISFPFVTVCKLHCCIWKSSSFFLFLFFPLYLALQFEWKYTFIIFEEWVVRNYYIDQFCDLKFVGKI